MGNVTMPKTAPTPEAISPTGRSTARSAIISSPWGLLQRAAGELILGSWAKTDAAMVNTNTITNTTPVTFFLVMADSFPSNGFHDHPETKVLHHILIAFRNGPINLGLELRRQARNIHTQEPTHNGCCRLIFAQPS